MVSISSSTSGLKAFNKSFTTCETVFPFAFSANFFFSFSVICLSNRVKRLANEVNNSSSLAPTATACNNSFNGTPGFFSNGRLSVFKLLVTPMASTITKWSLVNFAVGVTFLKSSNQWFGCPAFHLLKIIFAFYIPHKKQTFQRFYIGAGGNHINRYGNTRVIVVAELGQCTFRDLRSGLLYVIFLQNLFSSANSSLTISIISLAWLSVLAKINVFGTSKTPFLSNRSLKIQADVL